MNQQQ
jgi:hypothetical protein